MIWGKQKLGSHIATLKGFAFKSKTYKPYGVPVVRVSDFTDNSISDQSLVYLDFDDASQYSKYRLCHKDIIIQTVGSWQHNPASIVGKVIRVPANLNGALLNQNAVKIIPDDHTDRDFLYYRLKDETFQKHVIACSQGAANQASITLSSIRQFSFNVPPLPIQQKIAGILSAYDDLIENNLKRIKLLEELAQITYEEWFVRFRFPGHESTPINPETNLPEGWERKAISSICDINKNSITARSAPETVRYIDISSAETGYYAPATEMPFSEAPSRARRRVAFGDTIFSTVRPNRRVFSLVLEDDPLLIASTGFAVLTPHRKKNYPFIYLAISQQSFTASAVAVAGGAAYPAVNQKDFERIKIILPAEELMNKFSDLYSKNFSLKANLLQENDRLREARDILLPRLMTGMIDVEHYDPAQLLKEDV